MGCLGFRSSVQFLIACQHKICGLGGPCWFHLKPSSDHCFPSFVLAEGWSMDPRLEDLGQRTIRGKKDKPPAGADETETTPLEYQRWRALNGVAEGDTEMASGAGLRLFPHQPSMGAGPRIWSVGITKLR